VRTFISLCTLYRRCTHIYILLCVSARRLIGVDTVEHGSYLTLAAEGRSAGVATGIYLRKPRARCKQWARDRDRSSVDPFRRRSRPSCHALQLLLQTDSRRATPPPHNPWQNMTETATAGRRRRRGRQV